MGLPITLKGVTHRYGRTTESAPVEALHDVSLRIEDGEFAVLTGPSGSGKSTLLHLIGAVDRPTSGSVRLGDTETSRLSERELTLLRRTSIGFVFQFFHLIPTLTVAENAAFPLRLNGVPVAEADERVAEVLGRVRLDHRSGHYPNELSGGEMQRVAIARAVVHRPRIVLADEPTGNLDTSSGETILELLAEIHQSDRPTIVMATHSSHAASFGRAHFHIMDGRLFEGKGED